MMKKSNNNNNSNYSLTILLLSSIVVPIAIACLVGATNNNNNNPKLALYSSLWFVVQWFPAPNVSGNMLERLHWSLLEEITIHMEDNTTTTSNNNQLSIPIVNVQQHRNNLLEYLETTHGKDWRKRPVLFQELWTHDELQNNNNHKLSLENLLQLDLQIPYFTNATQDLLSPDDHGSVKDIVRNMTTLGKPHKIGTQFILESNPEWIKEVAPSEIVTELFGNYFSPEEIKGSGPFRWFPATTTVPVFIANHEKKKKKTNDNDNDHEESPSKKDLDDTTKKVPFTALHCEPIGNIAVQLSGQKQWTLVQPEHSFRIKPTLAPDGRAFFASWANETEYQSIPTYTAVTRAGDAIWVPTWTWHRVDYIPSSEIAIGGSLFHFRPFDFLQNNPLFAVLIIPAMMKELLGFNTQ